jgi:cytochrome P450
VLESLILHDGKGKFRIMIISNPVARAGQTISYDLDLFLDAELLNDPHERVKQLISDAPPVFWTPRNGGHWVATKYEDIFSILHQTEVFSSLPYSPERWSMLMAALPLGMPRIPNIVPVLTDPPSHKKYRAPLQKAFSPRVVANLRIDVEDLTNRLLDAIIEQGGCEFISTIGEQLPVQTFLKLMGLPIERLTPFRELVRQVLGPGNPLELAKRLRDVADSMLDIIVCRRSEPKDDLISQLWATDIDGQAMTLEMMEDYAVNLFLGGMDTVTNAIGFGMRHLAKNPDLQNELRLKPNLVHEMVEESLRRYSFVILRRRVARDTELRGQQLLSGDTIYLYLPAAALDNHVFPDPEMFDVTRSNINHMAFGAGPHTCVGANLARLELQTLYSAVLKKLPRFRLDPNIPTKFHAGTIFAVASLGIRWD